jgi:hypothetical protein
MIQKIKSGNEYKNNTWVSNVNGNPRVIQSQETPDYLKVIAQPKATPDLPVEVHVVHP